jgi:hypothetical protein
MEVPLGVARTTFTKRQKERARQERQQQKAQKKAERKNAKAAGPDGTEPERQIEYAPDGETPTLDFHDF